MTKFHFFAISKIHFCEFRKSLKMPKMRFHEFFWFIWFHEFFYQDFLKFSGLLWIIWPKDMVSESVCKQIQLFVYIEKKKTDIKYYYTHTILHHSLLHITTSCISQKISWNFTKKNNRCCEHNCSKFCDTENSFRPQFFLVVYAKKKLKKTIPIPK